MSRKDGYGSTVQEYRDSPTNPFSTGYQQREPDYADIVDEISNNILTITNGSTTLERSLKQLGTQNDSVQLRDRIHACEQTTNGIINSTAASLRQLSTVCGNNRQYKLQYQRLTNEFKQSVQRYNRLQHKVAERVRSCQSPSGPSQTSRQTDLINWGDTVTDEQQQQQQQQQQQRQQQLEQQQEDIDIEVAVLQEREERIRQLETDILDINEIFRDLGTMVHEQGEAIDTIEANVESAHGYVEAGNEQLVKASQYQRKARKKMCILIVILLIVVGIIGLVIYLAVR